MSLADEFAAVREADLQEIEAHFNNNTFSHATGSGLATPTSMDTGSPLIIGGKVITMRHKLIIRASAFSAAPAAKQPITFNSVEYRIADVKLTADGVHYEIPLTGLNEL